MHHSFGYPPSDPIPVTGYEISLLNLIGGSSRLGGISYSLDDLYIDEAYHMKSKTPIGHEFVVLTVANYNNEAQRFRVRLERVLGTPCSIRDLPPEARASFEARLDDRQRKALAKFRRSASLRSWFHKMFRRSDPTETPTARALEASTSMSTSLHTGPALDRISAFDKQPTSAHILRCLKFHNRCLPMLQAISAASAISRHFEVYSPFRTQCFFYADSIMRCCERIAATEASEIPIPHHSSARREDTDCEEVRVGTKRKWGRKCGFSFLINIYRFQESMFRETIWPFCEAHQRKVEDEVAKRLAMTDSL